MTDTTRCTVNDGEHRYVDNRCVWCDASAPLSRVEQRVAHLEMVMRECCDAIRDNDDIGALRMMEVALKEQTT